jgi:hypothetical protein
MLALADTASADDDVLEDARGLIASTDAHTTVLFTTPVTGASQLITGRDVSFWSDLLTKTLIY